MGAMNGKNILTAERGCESSDEAMANKVGEAAGDEMQVQDGISVKSGWWLRQ
jgi:hypothetical protein